LSLEIAIQSAASSYSVRRFEVGASLPNPKGSPCSVIVSAIGLRRNGALSFQTMISRKLLEYANFQGTIATFYWVVDADRFSHAHVSAQDRTSVSRTVA
jgi:hypothetical protein